MYNYSELIVLANFKAYTHMGLLTTKSVFGVSDKARLKSASTATETS